MKTNFDIIPTDSGYWINLDKTCCIPFTEKGEVVYFKTEKEALMVIYNDENFINEMLLLLIEQESQK